MRRFLPKLKQYLRLRDIAYMCVRTVQDLQVQKLNEIHGYILSGSSKNIGDMRVEDYLLNMLALEHVDVPVLGICFGAQFLHTYYGGSLEKLQQLHCGKFMVQHAKGAFPAMFCNRYVLNDVATGMRAIGHYEVEGKMRMCAFKHKKKPIYGILFHPEHSAATYPILDAFVDRTRVLARLS